MNKNHSNAVFFACLAGMSISCSGDPGPGADQKARVAVQAAAVEKGNIGKYLSVPGITQAVKVEKTRAPITGKIIRLQVLEGDPVRKGDTLLTILSKESEAAILGARQMLARAATEAQKLEAEEAVRLAENYSSTFRVIAPFNGAVSSRAVNEGEYVNEGADLLEIVDLQSIYFIADVPVPYAGQIRKGLPVKVQFSSMPLTPIAGEIAAVGPQADVSSQSLKVRISMAKIPLSLKVGTAGAASILVEERKNVLLVPRQAVYHNDELDTYVVVQIEGDSLALRKQVEVGLQDSARVEVLSGLKLGDRVITIGGYELPDSTLVKIQ